VLPDSVATAAAFPQGITSIDIPRHLVRKNYSPAVNPTLPASDFIHCHENRGAPADVSMDLSVDLPPGTPIA
jgi:hypothetical protein